MSKLAVANSVHAMGKSGRDKYFSSLNKNTKLVKTPDSDKIMSVEDAALQLGKMLNG